MLKKRLFCDRLYLIGLKNALIDGKKNVKLNEQYDICIHLGEGEIERCGDDGFPILIVPALLAKITLKNTNTNLDEYSLSIKKYNPLFAINKSEHKLMVIKNMTDFQRNKFILERDTTSLISCRRYYFDSFEGIHINSSIYQYVKEQATKDYKLLKQIQKTLKK